VFSDAFIMPPSCPSQLSLSGCRANLNVTNSLMPPNLGMGDPGTMSSDQPWFAHRINGDRSFDSICMKCYRTVDTQSREAAPTRERESSHLRPGRCAAARPV
jgi:hypothetical protein